MQTPFIWDDKFREWSRHECAKAKPETDLREFFGIP